MKIVITRKFPDDVIAPLRQLGTVEMWPEEEVAMPREQLLAAVRDADAIIAMLSDKIDAELFAAAPQLKVVANLAVGFDNIDVATARERHIYITNTPQLLTDTTADLTFALMLMAGRRLGEALQYVKDGEWKSWGPFLLAGLDVHHKTVGIVGMGSIGTAVARRAKGFAMNVLYHNRSRNEAAEQEVGAQYVSFTQLLAESDYVVCLTPLTEQTRGLFNREAFAQMKKSAVFINVARGAVCDEAALYEALTNGTIAAAGLDVFAVEPIGADHPLLALPNVVALPHIGSASVETRTKMMELCVDNVAFVLEGNEPKTIVK